MASEERSLLAFFNDSLMGVLERGPGGKLTFSYDAAYRRDGTAVPLSLSMPLTRERHTDDTVSPWLWGLLPDNDIILARWARRFHVSPRSCFALLQAMGEDCAGAVRFVTERNEDKVLKGGRVPLVEEDIERRIADLRHAPTPGREPQDRGQFSLAGAQSKTALQRRGDRWYIPWGREPTTHILKPPRIDLDGHVENEYFCLSLAAAIGLPVANAEILTFGEEKAIAVERYDRITANRRLLRVHQEDICQALGIHPTSKYQCDGGPGIPQVMELLNRSSQPVEDRRRFMQAIVFNYWILGSDAHAKNYSLLLGRNGQVRLARLYDLASLLPYVDRRKDCRFAMKIDRYYRDDQIQYRHFEKLARSCEFPSTELLQIIEKMATELLQHTHRIATDMQTHDIHHPVIERIINRLEQRIMKTLIRP